MPPTLRAGRWIDRTQRLRAALVLTVAQHALVSTSCSLFVVLLFRSRVADASGAASACSKSSASLAFIVRQLMCRMAHVRTAVLKYCVRLLASSQ